jgi:hypothetical protein
VRVCQRSRIFPLSIRNGNFLGHCHQLLLGDSTFLNLPWNAVGSRLNWSFWLQRRAECCGFSFTFLVCPETSKLSLEELDSIFSISTLTHARYQCTEVLPWWVKRWILYRKNEYCMSLFEFQAKIRAQKQVN